MSQAPRAALLHLQFRWPKESEHVFAHVKLKQSHPHSDCFGISATICFSTNEPFSM